MNTFTLTRRTISARFMAVVTIVSMMLSAFPVAFFVAEAATNLSGPDSETFTPVGSTSYESADFDATGYDLLKMNFSFAGPSADSNDTIEYGWKQLSDPTENLLGQKAFSNGEPPADAGAIEVVLPGAAAASDLIVFIRVKAGSTFTADDEIALTNIIVSGDNYPVPPDGTLNETDTAYSNPQDNVRICHYDSDSDSYPNPDQNVDISSIVNGNGHGGHANDIIPPFWYNFGSGVELYVGNGWNVDSQEIYNNDCVRVLPPETCDDGIHNQDETGVDQGGVCTPEPENACLLPNTLGDTETFVLGVSPEKTLQLILDDAGFTLDAEDDQINTQVWDFADSDTDTVTFTVTVIDKIAANKQAFGYYVAGDNSSFVPLFKVGAHTAAVPTLVNGDSVNFEVPMNIAESIGFALDTEGSKPNLWFSELALNPNTEDNLGVYNPSDNVYVLAFEDLAAANGDNDHNDLVVKIDTIECHEEIEEPCTPEQHVFADNAVDNSQGLTNGGSAVAASRSNTADATGTPDWTAGGSTGFYSLGFGGWITVSFDKFVMNVAGDDLSVHEATNGTYPVEKAKVEVSQDGGTWYTLTEEARNDSNEGGSGVTLLDFDETGLDWIKYVRLTDTSNAALHNSIADGFDLDTVDATYVVCDEPQPDPKMVAIHTYKVVCTEEADLPNWNTDPSSGAPTITGSTAADWVAEHDSCRLVEGWEFEWAQAGTGDPGDTLIGTAGGAWTTFTGTTNILMSNISGSYLWMREVLKDGYIPFTHEGEGNKNTDDYTAEFYCHIDGLNYDNIDRIDSVSADGEYYCVAWNAPTEPDIVYGPYCGDGSKNQAWEQCDGTDGNLDGGSCTDYCTLDNQCSSLPLVKITLDENAPASKSFDGTLHLGATGNIIPNGTWFLFAQPGDTAANTIANGAMEGLAIERTPTELRLAVKGGNARTHYDYVFGDIETLGIDLGAVNRSPIVGWPLENSGEFKDIFTVDNNDESAEFKFWLTNGDDSASVAVTPGDEYGYCPECYGEVEARIILNDSGVAGAGDLSDEIILGDAGYTTVAFGEWFKLSEAPAPNTSAVMIADPNTVTNFADPANKPGLFVSRENGTVKVALYGNHNPGGNVNHEWIDARIEVRDAGITNFVKLTSDYKLENHNGNVPSNSGYDVATPDVTGVNFKLWVDTASDGFKFDVDTDTIVSCEDDTDPKDPVPDTYRIDGYKYEVTDNGTSTVSGWTIYATNIEDEVLLSTTTDSNGHFWFEGLTPGLWDISEDVPTDWTQVAVHQDGVRVETEANVEECSFTLPSESDYECDFYNQLRQVDQEPDTYRIDGFKHELGSDYIAFLPDWTIELRNSGGDLIMSTTTDSNGYYYFDVLAGDYQIHEVMQTDWFQSEVREDSQLVETDADVEFCTITTPDESDYDCDFYNVYDPEDNGPEEPILGCTDSSANNYNPSATLGNANSGACTYDEVVTYSGGGSSSGGRPRAITPTPLVLGESTVSHCPFLTEYMQIGWQNDPWQVIKLQLFLNSFKDTFGGTTNPVTGVFGQTTDANVKAFQMHYRSEILDPWYDRGIVPHNRPTGFVYKTTLWKINSIVCPVETIIPSLDGEDLNTNIDIDPN